MQSERCQCALLGRALCIKRDLFPGDGDSDVLDGTECPDDPADAEPGRCLEVSRDRPGREHDGEMGSDRVTGAVEHGPGAGLSS